MDIIDNKSAAPITPFKTLQTKVTSNPTRLWNKYTGHPSPQE